MRKYSIAIIVFLVAILIFVKSLVEQSNKSTQKKNATRLELYSTSLCIEGDFIIDDNKVIINNKFYNQKKLIQDVALYNAFYKEDTITTDMLMEEFDVFCDGMNESELIETYRDGMKSIKARAAKVEIFVDDYDYERVIIEYLKETYNTRLSDATVEEMKEACPYAAEAIYKEVLSLEEQKN